MLYYRVCLHLRGGAQPCGRALFRRVNAALRSFSYPSPFGERHLRHLLKSYQRYYNEARTHLSLSKDAPVSRAVQTAGSIIATPLLGGLHHQYVRI